MVVQDPQNFWNLNNHPVCGAKVAPRHFLDAAAAPPGQEGRWLPDASSMFTALLEQERMARTFSNPDFKLRR